jgi:hypothetical protein
MSAKKKAPAQNTGVGYGRPPAHSRFRKGQSGNPTGARRHREAEHAVGLMRQEAYRLLTIREGNKVTRMPALRVVLRSLLTLAAKGNVTAQRAVVKAVQDMEEDARARRTGGSTNKKFKDVNDMTDEELMAIIETAQDDRLA